jgi:hypothetical protein
MYPHVLAQNIDDDDDDEKWVSGILRAENMKHR